jgi:hypothetical protein
MNQEEGEGYITYISRRQQGEKHIFHQEELVEENQPEVELDIDIGDENENNALQILEGLATGKRQLAQILTQLISTNQANQNHRGNNGKGR